MKSTRQELMNYATEYTIDEFKVVWRGNSWAILDDMKRCWNKKEDCFVWEPFPSNRDDEFFNNCRFGLLEAQKIVFGFRLGEKE